MGPGRERLYIVKSAARALAILDAIRVSPRGKDLAGLSAELRLHKSTALRILRTLVAEHVLQRDSDSGLYALDARSWLGMVPHVHPALSFLSAVQSRLDELAAVAQATTVLVLPCLAQRYAVGWMHSEPSVPVHFDPSALIGVHAIPLHAAASGKCYLASLPPDILSGYLEALPGAATLRTITSPRALEEELQRVREQGYAGGEEEAYSSLRTLAVPVGESDGKVVGGLSLLFVSPSDGHDSTLRALPPLRKAAEAISEMLSYRWWTENVMKLQVAAGSLAAPWETADPGFGDGPTPSVRSVVRLIRLLETLLVHPRGMSLGALSQARSLNKAAAWRLLNTLMAHEIVWQSLPDKAYHISPLFWMRQSSLVCSASSLARETEAILQDLSDVTEATATLELPDRDERNSIVHQFALPTCPIRVHPAYSTPLPLHSTAAGKCYLAAQSKLAIRNYAREGLTPRADRATITHGQLIGELEQVRAQGYASGGQQMGSAVAALAVPLTDAAGTTVGGIAVSFVPEGDSALPPQHLLSSLRHAAVRLSRLLIANWRS